MKNLTTCLPRPYSEWIADREDTCTDHWAFRYLAVDYMIADLYIRSYNATREATLRAALGLFESFLERLDQYSVLSRADRELFGRFQEEKSTFRLVTKDNAEERRKSKISRFQEEKVLKAQLQVRTLNKSLISFELLVAPERRTGGC